MPVLNPTIKGHKNCAALASTVMCIQRWGRRPDPPGRLVNASAGLPSTCAARTCSLNQKTYDMLSLQ